MMPRLPSLFVSHDAPTFALDPARRSETSAIARSVVAWHHMVEFALAPYPFKRQAWPTACLVP